MPDEEGWWMGKYLGRQEKPYYVFRDKYDCLVSFTGKDAGPDSMFYPSQPVNSKNWEWFDKIYSNKNPMWMLLAQLDNDENISTIETVEVSEGVTFHGEDGRWKILALGSKKDIQKKWKEFNRE